MNEEAFKVVRILPNGRMVSFMSWLLGKNAVEYKIGEECKPVLVGSGLFLYKDLIEALSFVSDETDWAILRCAYVPHDKRPYAVPIIGLVGIEELWEYGETAYYQHDLAYLNEYVILASSVTPMEIVGSRGVW